MLTIEVKLQKNPMLTVRPNIKPNHIKWRVIKEPPCHAYWFYCSVCLLRRSACITLNWVLATLENVVKHNRKDLGDPGNSGRSRQALAVSPARLQAGSLFSTRQGLSHKELL